MDRIIEANNVFTPYRPIIEQNLFCGRKIEINQLTGALSAGGCHALLYGDRGVGKTSLARHSCQCLGLTYYVHQCSSEDTFVSIVEDFLTSMGFQYNASESVSTKGSVNVAPLGLGASTDVEKSSSKRINYSPDNPSWVSKQLQNNNCVLIIDEYDVIKSAKEKFKISQLIKSLSDINSEAKILVVGIGSSAKELLEGHESIVRCLEEVHLGRMSETELRSILENGAERLDLSFDEDVKNTIVKASIGFPYFTHLLGLKSVIATIQKDLDCVSMEEYNEGLELALRSMDRSLQDSYKEAIGDSNNLVKRQLLYCVATANTEEITTRQIKALHEKEYGIQLDTVNINYNLSKAMGNDSSALLRRMRKGVYVFSNPLMPVYIRLLGKPPVK